MTVAAALAAEVPWNGYETLVALLHGESGIGKSPVSWTAPGPLLILDNESSAKFYGGRKVFWNPLAEAPPAYDGTWDACIVRCLTFEVFLQTYKWLNSGQHPFRSVILDSLTELQKRCKDLIFDQGLGQGASAADEMNERRWGLLLGKMEQAVRDMRDLTMHPTTPLQCVVFIALTDEKKRKLRPFIQGALGTSMPGFVDLVGYLYAAPETEHGPASRQMLIQPTDWAVAKDRSSGNPSGGLTAAYGALVPAPINLSQLITTIYA